MIFSLFSSLGTRWSNGPPQHAIVRAAWAAVLLLAMSLVFVPMQRTISAEEPEFTINVTDIDFETASATFTAENLPSTLNSSNWIASVSHKAPSSRFARTQSTGPGRSSSAEGDFEATLSGDANAKKTLTSGSISLTGLMPAAEHTLTVTIYELRGNTWVQKAKESTTFTTEEGCVSGINPGQTRPGSDTRPSWYSLHYFTDVTETELTLVVHVASSQAPVNSGACVYFKTGQANVIQSAYVHGDLPGGLRGAIIRQTDLLPGTRYNFTLSIDSSLSLGNVGVSGTTLERATAISAIEFSKVTQSSADAKATISNASNDDKFVYLRYRTSPVGATEADKGSWNPKDRESTKTDSATFSLSNLDAGTRYEVEASVDKDYSADRSHTGYFVTLPGKPGISPLEESDTKLKVSWTAPAADPAPITGYRVQWQAAEEKYSSNNPPTTDTLGSHDFGADSRSYTITGLSNGTKYVVQVIAKNVSFDDYGGTSSDLQYGTPMGLPGAPQYLQVAPGNAKLTLTWGAPVNDGSAITGYVVEWKLQSTTGWASPLGSETLAGDDFSHTIDSLTNGTEYAVRVRADNGVAGDSYNWATGGGTPDDIPGPPKNLNISEGNAKLTLTWEAPVNDGSAITGYKLEWKADTVTNWDAETGITRVDVNGLTSEIMGLTNGTTYDVRVRADNGVVSDSYNWATGDGTPDAIPGTPESLDISEGNARLDVTWEEPSNDGSAITGYVVEWKLQSTTRWASPLGSETLAGDDFSHTIDSLTNGTEYAVRVRADNGVAGDSYNWATGGGTPDDIPGPPKNLNISEGNAKLTLTWEAPVNDGSAITGYKLEWKADTVTNWDAETGITRVDVNGLTSEIMGLTNGTTYDVRVRADNGVVSDSYNWATGDGTPDAIPGTPESLDISEGNARLDVTWEEPSNDGSAITGYVVEWKLQSTTRWASPLGSETLAGDDFSHTIDSLTNGTEYAVRVRADNGVAGDSYNWATGGGTPDDIPGPPKNLNISEGNAKLTLTWEAPVNDGSAITGYKLEWKADTVTNWDAETGITRVDVNGLTSEIMGLTNGTTYDVRVRADNGVVSDSYNWATGDGTPDAIPGTPESLDISEGNARLDVTWEEPSNDGSAITGYVVEWKLQSTTRWASPLGSETLAGDDFSHTIDSLTNGTEYAVRVRADNGVAGDSYNWATGGGTPDDIPGPPKNLNISEGNAKLTLTWEAPVNDGSAITGYKLEWKADTVTNWDAETGITRVDVNGLTSEIMGLTNGTTYDVRVRAENGVVMLRERP